MIGSTTWRRVTATGAVAALVLSAAALIAPPAGADAPPAGLSPVVERSAKNVTADALPTVQIDNGVVWTEKVVGNRVFAGGSFSNARPAGAAAGTNLTPRGNLLAFDITTGLLDTSFAPSLNGQVQALAVSPDGTRLYVGGSFTIADGANRYRVAAYDLTTNQLVSTWAPALDATVNAISVTNDAVYVGGGFSTANGVARSHLAAFSPTSGALLDWAPTTDNLVQGLVVTPDGSRVIVGGSFLNVNGAANYGLAAIDASTGAVYPWAANQVVRDAGTAASILSVTTDGKAIYTTAYVYGTTGNFEGVMSADPDSGTINWLADCHGDTYGAFGVNDIVYVVSHQHYCANIGGFPDTNPRSVWHRATAFTANATGTVAHNGEAGGGYGDFAGQPSPSLINWLPDLDTGTFTGQTQAAWSVSGNSDYVVLGGEFPKVNGTAQYGLVRFGVPGKVTPAQGPRVSAAAFVTNFAPLSSTSVRVSWQTNWDRDEQDLTYTITRNSTPIYTTTYASWSWYRPVIGFVDSGLSPNTSYTYRVAVSDPDGHVAKGNSATVTTPASGSALGTYGQDVLNGGATDYWRLGQAAGSTTSLDYAGFNDLNLASGVTAGTTGAILGDSDTASTFSGSSSTGYASTLNLQAAPNTFSAEAWFSTTTTTGGKLIGFGSSTSGSSSNYDRHVYMDNAGRLNFGVYNGSAVDIRSASAYNDGAYHHVVATLSGAGMALYVDGQLVGANTGTTSGQAYSGYWRVGGDSLASWPNAPSSGYFKGTLDDVAIYPTALTLQQVRQHFVDSGRNKPGFVAPADTYGATVWNSAPRIYYRMDDTSGTTATDTSGNLLNGTYVRGYTLGGSSPVTGTGSSIAFNGSTGTMNSGSTSLSVPSTYSMETWFKTSASSNGKLIGLGNSATGTSTSTDRNLYVLGNGKLVFGVLVGTKYYLATSPAAYNDGKWHYAAATQGADGMTLYVDGAPVATNAQTGSKLTSGIWRIGGDSLAGSWVSSGSTAGFFNGSLDEVALYNAELSATDVRSHYKASPAAVLASPVAAFTSAVNGASVSFDATGSKDPDGTVVSYSWDFGDGTTGTGATPSHTYAKSGAYVVNLTVTDDSKLTGTVSHSVLPVVPNKPPVAAFTLSASDLAVAVDGTGSSDPDGTIASYAWDFGDGGAATTATANHAYAKGGTYTITLTVTDDGGATTSVSHDVSVLAANQLPQAAFSTSVAKAVANFDASASNDTDGTITSYAWDFGDGSTGTGVSPTHTYAVKGTYPVTLTVTDDRSGQATVSHDVVVTLPNQAPTAAFTTSGTLTTVNADGSGSNDADGTIASYAWTFGDGTSGSGATPTHVYAATGTYTITLTVTDNEGAIGTVSHDVTVTDVFAADAFSRTVTGGWGSADIGGAWTRTGGATNFSVNGSQGLVTLATPGSAPTSALAGVSATNVNMLLDVGIDQAATGNGVYITPWARHTAAGDLRVSLRLLPAGVVHLAWSRIVSGKETVVSEIVVKNLTYNVGDMLRLRFQLINQADGSTAVQGTVWNPATSSEPAAPQLKGSDTTAALQAPGSIGIYTALAANATASPVTVRFDNLSAKLG